MFQMIAHVPKVQMEKCVSLAEKWNLTRTSNGVHSDCYCIRPTYPGFYHIDWLFREAALEVDFKTQILAILNYEDNIRRFARVIETNVERYDGWLKKKGWSDPNFLPIMWTERATLEAIRLLAIQVGDQRCHLTRPSRDQSSDNRMSILMFKDDDAVEKANIILALGGDEKLSNAKIIEIMKRRDFSRGFFADAA